MLNNFFLDSNHMGISNKFLIELFFLDFKKGSMKKNSLSVYTQVKKHINFENSQKVTIDGSSLAVLGLYN